MSETLFEYRCICMGGETKGRKVARGKDLQFFLVRDFNCLDRNSGMRVQVVFPKAFRDMYRYVRVEYEPNGVGLPLEAQGGRTFASHFYRDLNATDGDDSVPDTNSVFIFGQKGNISCEGRILFIKDGKDPDVPASEVPLEDTYIFALNFRQKSRIYYKIVERGKYIDVEINYPRLLKDLKLNVLKKQGSKPLTLIDYAPENMVKMRKDPTRPAEITLKRNALDSNHETGTIFVGTTDGYNFRLVFSSDQDWNPSEDYILSDESKPRDVSEKDPAENNRIKEEKRILASRKKKGLVPICPYCGRPIHPEVISSRSGIFDCQNTQSYKLGKNIDFDKQNLKKKKKLVFCSEKLVAKSKGYITTDMLILPDDYEYRPAPKILTVGYPNSGKTIFLSSLINMKRRGENVYESKPFILNEILRFFSPRSRRGGNHDAQEVMMRALKKVDNNVYTEDDSYELERSNYINDVPIKGRYAINVDGRIEAQTKASTGQVLAWNPIAYRLDTLGHIYFYDAPGEYYMAENHFASLHSVDVADGIIALLDTCYDDDTTKSKKKGVGANTSPAHRLVEALRRLRDLSPTGRDDLRELPVAVVLTKIDHHYDEHYDPRTAKFNDVFDPNCHVTQKNMAQLFPKNGRYEGSDIEEHINNSSYEIEEYLKGKNWGDEVKEIKAMFPNVKFFALSALGSDDVLGESQNVLKEIRYLPSRVRMELPIVWLMVQTGLIRR